MKSLSRFSASVAAIALVCAFAARPLDAQQDRPTRYFLIDPVNPCSVITPLVNNWMNGKLWQCVGTAGVNNGTWHLISSGANTVAWGAITGTLSSQADLVTALGLRLLASNNLSDVASAATSRTNLGLGTAAVNANGFFLQTANNLSDGVAATMRTNLGLGAAAMHGPTVTVNGTACTLDSTCAPSASAAWGSITGTLSSQADLVTALGLRLLASNNLSDVASAATSRTNLGLGTAAVNANGFFLQTANNLSDGVAATMRTNLGLGSLATLSAVPCADMPALLGDTTSSAGSCTTATAKINGGTVPTSAHGLGTDGSAKPIAQTAHDPSAIADCIAASGSGTTYTCATSPTFTPAAGDSIIFEADVASTGAATLNVNSAGAKGIKKQGGGTALLANDLITGQWTKLVYDGTNWQMQGQAGNAAAGASITQGTWASLPGTCVTNDLYYETDAPFRSRCSATNTWSHFNDFLGLVTPPVLGNFSWTNQASATTDTTHGGIILSNPTTESGIHDHSLVKAAPVSTPYHVIACFDTVQVASTNSLIGLEFRNSVSGKHNVWGVFQNVFSQLVAFYNSSDTVNGSTPLNNASWAFRGPYICLRIGDDGVTNRTYDVSADGRTWINIGSDARTTNFTADEVGIFMNAGPSTAHFIHYAETN